MYVIDFFFFQKCDWDINIDLNFRFCWTALRGCWGCEWMRDTDWIHHIRGNGKTGEIENVNHVELVLNIEQQCISLWPYLAWFPQMEVYLCRLPLSRSDCKYWRCQDCQAGAGSKSVILINNCGLEIKELARSNVISETLHPVIPESGQWAGYWLWIQLTLLCALCQLSINIYAPTL